MATVLGALGLAACGGQSGPVSKVPAEILRVAVGELAESLDPHAWRTAAGPRTLAPVYDALTFIQSDGKLRPSLAIAWTQKSPTVWQFRLRVNDARFHNGELFTAQAVRFTFERLRDARLPLSRLANRVERVEIVDPATVNIVTNEPDASLPRWMSAIYILPPSYDGQAVGTGFWSVQDFQPGSHLHLAVFRDSWRRAAGSDPPPLKRLLMDALPNRADAIRSLDVDAATEINAGDLKSLQAAGFVGEMTDLSTLNAQDAEWQTAAFGAPLGSGYDGYAAAANIRGVTALPNGSWWFDRVTKSTMQRIAVAGGA